MSSNNKISNLVSSQTPFFVRNDHGKFIEFLEAYYEYLEQSSLVLQEGKVLERRENLLNYMDIDDTLPDFEQYLYNKFLAYFPEDIATDKKLILKNAKDIFRAKGTEKSVRFMLRVLFGSAIDDVEIYYPKKDILRSSDGKWYIQKSLRITQTKLDDVSDDSIAALNKFTSLRITGRLSFASALVESTDRFYSRSILQDELVLSSIKGTFLNGEEIYSQYIGEDGELKDITANVRGGIIESLTINNPGTKYTTDDDVVIVSSSGQGAIIRIAKVTTGNIASIEVLNGGSGYQVNSFLSITGGGGLGANAIISGVDTSEIIHPNTYSIPISTIQLEANTQIGNLTYSNLMIGTSNTYNADNSIAETLSYFSYANTGPASNVQMVIVGAGYSSVPQINLPANTRIRNLGILGRIEINSGGSGYANGDYIQFIGGYGVGANATVEVNSSGSIISTDWVETPGFPKGGSGYSQNQLPSANVVTSGGVGANLSVYSTLGHGATFSVEGSTIGSIERLVIEDAGVGYEVNSSIDLTGSGDGTANVTATITEGVLTYPGRYLNDDGFLSSSNYLEDRDYYQLFSYVIRVKESIANYREVLKNITHPSGFKMFGEYLSVNNSENISYSDKSPSANTIVYKKKTYEKTANTVTINYTSHDYDVDDIIYLDFLTGNTVNSGIYNVVSYGANVINVSMPVSGTTTGNVLVGKSIA